MATFSEVINRVNCNIDMVNSVLEQLLLNIDYIATEDLNTILEI